MSLVVFDIDGTLTDTTVVDAECYTRAVRAVLGTREPIDWESLPDMTDATIIRAVWERDHEGPFDTGAEEAALARLVELLEDELRRSPDRFRPIPGGREVFGAMRERGWSVAMATGAWRPSAELKLRAAGIPLDGVPLATASDAVGRQEIIGVARSLASASGPVAYVGDGPWDVRAAHGLGLPFVGIGRGERAERLTAAGADVVLPDLSDAARLAETLEEKFGTG